MQDELDRKEEQVFRSKAKVNSSGLSPDWGQPREARLSLCLSVFSELLCSAVLG
jgi:hypothetical protein